MARFETFDRELRLATEGLSQEAIPSELARFAREELVKVITSGQASENYTRFVNGIEGAPEESVDAPGPILYQFAWWNEIITAALGELIKRSPKRSGKYSRSFVVLANQRPVDAYGDLPANAEVIIFNAQPYTRKIEVGAMEMSVPPRHFDATTATLRRRFGANGAFRIFTRFVNIKAGLHPLVPYLLKGEYARKRNAQLSAAKAGQLVAGSIRLHRRKDRDVGQPITYPAVVINMVQ